MRGGKLNTYYVGSQSNTAYDCLWNPNWFSTAYKTKTTNWKQIYFNQWDSRWNYSGHESQFWRSLKCQYAGIQVLLMAKVSNVFMGYK